MNRWETLVDRLVRDVIGNGDISHLPGAGRRLELGDDSHTPADMRMVFKIMQDHNVIPDWIMMGQALDEIESQLRKQIELRARRYHLEVQKARRKGTILDEDNANNSWVVYLKEYQEKIERHNKEVLLFNLKVPENVPHKQVLVKERLIQKALEKAEGEN